jgi:hypothetical protein
MLHRNQRAVTRGKTRGSDIRRVPSARIPNCASEHHARLPWQVRIAMVIYNSGG